MIASIFIVIVWLLSTLGAYQFGWLEGERTARERYKPLLKEQQSKG